MEIILGVGVGVFIIYAVFNIMYLMSMKRASERIQEFFVNTEDNLNGALSEMRGTLENMRKITGDARAVTEDVRQIADTAAKLERGLRDIYGAVKNEVVTAAEANLAGLKAGIAAGVVTLVKNMQRGRGDEHEGGAGGKEV